jgi:hypothetical protein
MGLNASNLGQIIGRLMYALGDDFAPSKPENHVPTTRIAVARGRRQKQLLEWLAGNAGAHGARAISDGMQISFAHATVLLKQTFDSGLVTRTGTRHSFRYSLP